MNEEFKKNLLNRNFTMKNNNDLYDKISKKINDELLNSNIKISDISFYTSLEEEKIKNILDNKEKDFLECRDVYTAVKVLKRKKRINGENN